MTIILRPFRKWRNSCFKKDSKEQASNVFSCRVTSRPSPTHTAPKTATLLRVGACSRRGSKSSGGTHMAQRDPCCWKWHSSSHQRSTSSLAARRRSFFICPLGFRVGLGNDRSRVTAPKSPLSEQPLALPNAQLGAVPLSQVMTEKLSVPHILGGPPITRGAPQVSPNLFQGFFIQRRWTPCSEALLQPGKPAPFESPNPILNRATALPQKLRHLRTTETGADKQNPV